MIHELRTYTILPRKKVKRIEQMKEMMPVFERHGIRVVGLWTPLIGRVEQFIYLLAWESLAEREQKWPKIFEDPDFKRIFLDVEPTIQFQDNMILEPTPYSPLR